jgi:preprotein translocase subunit SecA
VNRLRAEYARLGDTELRRVGREATALPEVVAATAVVASRVLGLEIFDVQVQGALALTGERIVEMQTGEGKTLTAVPAVVWYAKQARGIHVLTANDYLARRDARWMGGIYEWLGLSVGVIQQTLGRAERQAAYRCDVTYATANEVGFDYLRDQLALEPDEQVHRPFAFALIDEADSILIDEARVPLVIAGGVSDETDLALRADRAVRLLSMSTHFRLEHEGRDVRLTDAGVAEVESALGCANLFDAPSLPILTAVQEALHAHWLLRRDVDYLVKDDAVVPVDEFKGRLVHDRRWPAGLQTALEVKEGVARKRQGRVLGSITLQNLAALYPHVCGMTGTAATQAREFQEVYGLDVVTIPTHRPVIREDLDDRLFTGKAAKETAVVEEIHRLHATGRPVLVGTTSVEESERLSRALGSLPHQVLNARNEEREAAIIARAGERGAVTISTNMAGRGVDIRLGPGIDELGGLHVIGTNRHEARRIDNQLRGRAGRQGDPGSSQFFVSHEDPLMVKYGSEEGGRAVDPDRLQRMVEERTLEMRQFLHKYEYLVDAQRQQIQRRRQDLLTGVSPCGSDLERRVALTTIDDLWADYLVAVQDLRAGTVWVSLGVRDPFNDYVVQLHKMFEDLRRSIDEETATRFARAEAGAVEVVRRGATWTYLTTDEPFGTMTERITRGLVRLFDKRTSPP